MVIALTVNDSHTLQTDMQTITEWKFEVYNNNEFTRINVHSFSKQIGQKNLTFLLTTVTLVQYLR